MSVQSNFAKTMLYKILIMATLFSTFSCMTSLPVGVGQNPPATTYRPGFWQPVARVNIRRPIEIKLINQTDIPLEYDLTTNQDIAPKPISPGDTAIIKEFPIPAYILINPKAGTPDTPTFNLKFAVSAINNVVTVGIQKVGEEIPGNTTLNLHETGALYIY
jgi:hypothetical protein